VSRSKSIDVSNQKRWRAMQYLTLGRSGLHVSRACLGAMMFGHSATAPCNEDEARRIIDAFLDGGGNFIDTANRYTAGESEEVVGRAIKARRDDVVLATKGFGPIGDGPNDMGLGRKYLTRALDDSLRRLGTDYIDLYQCHRADPDTPVEETMAPSTDSSSRARSATSAARIGRDRRWSRRSGRPPGSAGPPS
jgi:aryl-alcohol dehydrogenase-like predicted oxidoreductase